MTAVATSSEMQGVPHHLLSILEPWETDFNVKKFNAVFWETVEAIRKRGNLPIVVGGTNYYLEAILSPLLPKPESKFVEIDDCLKKRILSSLETLDFQEMLTCLRDADPEAAQLTIKNDTRRVENALKRIVVSSENKITDEEIPDLADFKLPSTKDQIGNVKIIFLDSSAEEWLAGRLKSRINSMLFSEGGLSEIFELYFSLATRDFKSESTEKSLADQLKSRVASLQSQGVLQAIGYKEFLEYFSDLLGRNSASDLSELENKCRQEVVGTSSANSEPLKSAVSQLLSDTIKLTKKQRRYFCNRLLPSLDRLCLPLDVTSVEKFGSVIEAAYRYLQFDERPAEEKSCSKTKNKKVYFKCDVCSKEGVGEIERTVHFKSKGHWANIKKAKRLAANL